MTQLFIVSQWWWDPFPLTGYILVIVDIGVPPLLFLASDTQGDEYLSLVEAEGLQNSVAIVLEDFSKRIVESLIKDTDETSEQWTII